MSKKKRTVSEWRQLMAEQMESGQTQEDWCIANGVNLYTYRDRMSRIKKLDDEGSNRETLFKQSDGRVRNEAKVNALPNSTEQTTWVEVALDEARQPEQITIYNGKLVIEAGMLRMTADASFPMAALASLLREVMAPC
jgi:hypothetical protein